jgi:hypothetical protein
LKSAPKIFNLCDALKVSQKNDPCIGVVDEADIIHHIHSALLPHPEVDIQKRASLRDVLEAKKNMGMHIKEK